MLARNEALLEIADRLKDLRPDEDGLVLKTEQWRKKSSNPNPQQTFEYVRGLEPNHRTVMAALPFNGRVEILDPAKRLPTGGFYCFPNGGGRTKIQKPRNGEFYKYAFFDALLAADKLASFFVYCLTNNRNALTQFFGQDVGRVHEVMQTIFRKKREFGGVAVLLPEVMDSLPEKALEFQGNGGIIVPNYAVYDRYKADLWRIVNKAMGGIPSPQYAPALPH